MKLVSDLKESVAAMLSGIDLNNVDDLYGAFERAARTLVQKAKIPETQGTQNLMIYSGVTDYLIDSRIFGTSIIDIRPAGNPRNRNNFVFKKYSDDFDREKGYQRLGTMSTFDYAQGTPIIRIVSSSTYPQIILDPMSATTGWSTTNITGLISDATFYWQYPASLRFNISAAGSSATLTKTITPVDLTRYLGVGVSFLAVELPTADVTSFELRIGSSSSNYYKVTNTTGTLGNILNEFMLVAFDLSLATIVGSPNIAAITYLEVILNYNGNAQTNVRVGGLFIALPSPTQIFYGSAGFFLNNGVVSTSITGTTDSIILNDAAYSIYERECALAVLGQTSGGMGDSMSARIESELNGARARNGQVINLGLYDLYRGDNPSGNLTQAGNWYD